MIRNDPSSYSLQRPAPTKYRCAESIVAVVEHLRPIKSIIVLDGGHFDPQWGADAFSVNSLACLLDVGAELIRGLSKLTLVMYSVLVDDLGINCNESACNVTRKRPAKHRQLPIELEKLLEDNLCAKRDRVVVCSERNARNVGLRLLRRRMVDFPPLITETVRDGQVVMFKMQTADHSEIELASKTGDVWTAKCPLIMAAHYVSLVEKARLRFGRDRNNIILDVSEWADYGKVTRGSELAIHLVGNGVAGGGVADIINVSWADDLGHEYSIENFSCGATPDVRP